MPDTIATRATSHATRPETVLAKAALPVLNDILLVEDEDFDARRLSATLRVALGRTIDVRRVRAVQEVSAAIAQSMPDIVFIDDYLGPNDSALQTIPELRHAGYTGAIIVTSGEIDRARIIKLSALGANGALHKDDINSVTLTAAIHQALTTETTTPS